jgi:hypothetical protein
MKNAKCRKDSARSYQPTRPAFFIFNFAFLILYVSLSLWWVLTLAACTNARSQQTAAPGPPVLIELFTSEGCSSCPPADALLRDAAAAGRIENVEVIPLGFHVDYWDELGWKDRFSSHAYTRRQRDYATRFQLEAPYTPELVIDGRGETVGNDRAAIVKRVHEASQRARAVQLEVLHSSSDTLAVQVSGAPGADVLLAITESDLTTSVGGGENKGTTLRHAAVVRVLEYVGKTRDGSLRAVTRLHLQPDWNPHKLRAVVFAQRYGQGEVLGATSIPLADSPVAGRP